MWGTVTYITKGEEINNKTYINFPKRSLKQPYRDRKDFNQFLSNFCNFNLINGGLSLSLFHQIEHISTGSQ